jgi:hypothetical protein
MTTWLWIIGITAVVWPVIVALFLDGVFTKHINLTAERSENSHLAGLRAKGLRAEISKLQTIIEQQDALIAALWQKTFGFYSEGAYDSPKLPEYLGVKPQWSAHNSDWAGPVHYLVRYEPYPWGTHAEHLYFPD